jgi:hypothetical protein
MNYTILDGGVSPVQFKTLFTSAERIAIKTLKSTDPVVEDFYDILDDPRCTKIELTAPSTRHALEYFVTLGLLEANRVDEILSAMMV